MSRYRWLKFMPGDLVKIIAPVRRDESTPTTADPCVGVVLDGYDSNVYEPASARVLVGDKIAHYTDREIQLISPKRLVDVRRN